MSNMDNKDVVNSDGAKESVSESENTNEENGTETLEQNGALGIEKSDKPNANLKLFQSSFPTESENDVYVHKLYALIVRKEMDIFGSHLKTKPADLDINRITFEGPYVADIHKNLTPLQLACMIGDRTLLESLFQIDVDINYNGRYGKTPLCISCLYGHLEVVKWLIAQGADLNLRDVQGDCDTPLVTTVACYQPGSEKADIYYEIGKVLLESGACPDKGDNYGVCPLYSAVLKSDTRFTELLLSHKANPNARCSKYSSPLCRALDAGCNHNVEVLLRYKCDVNQTSGGEMTNSKWGPTPLHIAVGKNDLRILLMLLKAGAKLDWAGSWHYDPGSALHVAAQEEHLVSLWLLVASGGNINSQMNSRRDTPLLILSRRGCVEGVKVLLRLGADVDLESQMGTTAIWASVRQNHPAILHLLLATCCSIEIPSMEYHMYMPLTPLEIALMLQSWNIALTLLDAGAKYKLSALQTAVPESVPTRGTRNIRTRPAYRLSPEDHQALRDLRNWTSQTRSLKHFCRTILRCHFTTKLPQLLQYLNYPISLQNYIFMRKL